MILTCNDGTKVKKLRASEVPMAYWKEHNHAWDYPDDYVTLPKTANDCYDRGGYKAKMSGNIDRRFVLIPLRYVQIEENELGEISL